MLNAAETRLGAVNTIANRNRPRRRNIMTMKRPPAGCQERRRVGEAPRVRRRSDQLRVPLSSSSSHGKTTLQTWTANWRNKRRDKRRSSVSPLCVQIDFNGKKNIQSNTRNGKAVPWKRRRNDTWGALKEPRTNSLLFATTKEEREREREIIESRTGMRSERTKPSCKSSKRLDESHITEVTILFP